MPATPLEVTAADVLAWDRARGEPPLRCGLSPAGEEKLLASPPASGNGVHRGGGAPEDGA